MLRINRRKTMDFYGLYTGAECKAYEYLGAHKQEQGFIFRTFAPAAKKIEVIGEFNHWQGTEMKKVHDGNFWECHIPEAKSGQMYKYRITGADGNCRDHADPYGFQMELRPHSASFTCIKSEFDFEDKEWMKKRSVSKDKPLNIYEIHAGSWKKPSDKAEDWYTYEEIGAQLIPYLKEKGYNYVEVMPLSEHPCDESWGYQITGFFSPTSRYGTPEELKKFVQICHFHDIGVIMDFVPVHFAVDDYALWNYDGTALYEYPNQDVGKSEWGSCNFMHSRGEVRSFLQSSADYWLSEFHFDGLRMDAISNMIYWQGTPARGENRGAVLFLQNMNQGLKERFPSVMLIAEDSTARPDITKPVAEGGLGFDYKWDMGWMNDTLSYFQSSPSQRIERYHKLTFSMQYYYQENYLLPLSHDENVHGKATILQKMYGDYDIKFPQARAFYLYMYTHPGKKLNFMGNELGQLREWDEKREQDWDILKYPNHDAFCRFMKDLNNMYLENSALWQEDYNHNGFVWLDCHQEEKCIYVFERRSLKQRIIAIFNFSDKEQNGYQVKVPKAERLILLIDTNRDIYGGTEIMAEKKRMVEVEKKSGMVEFSLERFSGKCYLVE